MNEERLIDMITAKLEEYGMPKFKDNYPAMDVLQLVKDAGYSLRHPDVNKEALQEVIMQYVPYKKHETQLADAIVAKFSPLVGEVKEFSGYMTEKKELGFDQPAGEVKRKCKDCGCDLPNDWLPNWCHKCRTAKPTACEHKFHKVNMEGYQCFLCGYTPKQIIGEYK